MDDESGESMEPMEKSLTVVHSSLQRRPVTVSLQKSKNAASVTYLKPRSHRINWTGLYQADQVTHGVRRDAFVHWSPRRRRQKNWISLRTCPPHDH